jgi:hypothetical protein
MISKLVSSLKIALKVALFRISNSTNRINERQIDQLILMNQYRQLAASYALPKFQDTGFHTYSQTDEDGFLLYIFSLIGSTNKKVVEMCCGDGIECNAANLIINHGWQGLLLDGDLLSLEIGRKVYRFLKTTRNTPPQLVHAWITTENVNELVAAHGYEGEIDLLSLDMDGNDYWILKSLEVINPRVVILEYNTYWDSHSSVTVPYDPQFTAQIIEGAYYCGASLAAFVKLGRLLGYRLVGCNTHKYNAFFVRNDLGADELPEVSIESCLPPMTVRSASPNEYSFPKIKSLIWQEV